MIAYYSKKFSKIEQNYDIHDKELFAIIEVLKHWKQYCEKILKFDIYINYKNLTHFLITKIFNQQVRWMEFFNKFNLTIQYILK